MRLWEGMIWLNGLALTCAFAAQFGPWLSVQWCWAAAMLALGWQQRRLPALLAGTLALLIAFALSLVDLLGVNVGLPIVLGVFGGAVLLASIKGGSWIWTQAKSASFSPDWQLRPKRGTRVAPSRSPSGHRGRADGDRQH